MPLHGAGGLLCSLERLRMEQGPALDYHHSSYCLMIGFLP